MSQSHGRERWFGTETIKSRTAEGFAESYWCLDSSEMAWDTAIPLGKEHSCSYRRNLTCWLWCLGESLQQQVSAVKKGDASRVPTTLAESEAVSPHPFFSRVAEVGSLLLTPLLLSGASASACRAVQRTPPANPTRLETGDCPSAANAFGSRAKEIGWMVYNKTTKDYWLWFAFQRLRSSFKCLGLHLSPRYRPAQASTFMVQDISKGLSLYFTAVRYQTLSFSMIIQSKQAIKKSSKYMWSCGSLQPQAGHLWAPGSSIFPVLSHRWHASAAGMAWEG